MLVQIIIAAFGEFTQEIIYRLYQELRQIMKNSIDGVFGHGEWGIGHGGMARLLS